MILFKTIFCFYFLIFILTSEVISKSSPRTQIYQTKSKQKTEPKFYQQTDNFQKSMIFQQQPHLTIHSQNHQTFIPSHKKTHLNTQQNNFQQGKFFYVLSPLPSPKVAQFSINEFFQKFMQDYQQMTNSLQRGPYNQNNPIQPPPTNKLPQNQDLPTFNSQNLRNQGSIIQKKQTRDKILPTSTKKSQILTLPPALKNSQNNNGSEGVNMIIDKVLEPKIIGSTQDSIEKQVLNGQNINKTTANLNNKISIQKQIKNSSETIKDQRIIRNQTVSTTLQINGSTINKTSTITVENIITKPVKQQSKSSLFLNTTSNLTSKNNVQEKIQTQQTWKMTTQTNNKSQNILNNSLDIQKAKKQINQMFKNFNSGFENNAKAKYIDNPAPKLRQKRKREIVSNQFDGIGLYQRVPLIFMEGQVYKFSGIVLNSSLVASKGSFKINFISAILSDRFGQNQFKCYQQLQKNLEFQMSCKMQKAGIYYLSLFAGLNGQSTRKTRNIMSSSRIPPLSISQPPNPINVHLQIIDNKLYVVWDSTAGLTNLTIYQENNRRQYILSNFHQKFKLPFTDFKQFNPIITYIEVSHADTSDGSLAFIKSNFGSIVKISFKATQHAFQQYSEESISLKNEIPWKVNIGDKIKLQGFFKEDIKNQAYVIEPDLNIRKLYFSQQRVPLIRSKNSISLDINFTKQGTHILEINNMAGLALVNRPIYVGQSYPLLPDYRDQAPLVLIFKPNQVINNQKIFEDYYQKTTQKINKRQPSLSSSIQQKRDYMLTLLNGLRKKHGVAPLELSDELNRIAQNHSDDMARNNYFSHSSLNGDGPGDRAKKMGFYNSIGENIAQARYLTEAHLGLQRSAGHLQNSVSKGWMRVGIGISQNNNGDYIVAFSFSSRDYKIYPLTAQQQQSIKKQLFNIIKEKNPTIVRQNTKLSADIKRWIQLGKDPNLLSQILRKNGFRGSMTASSFTFSKGDGWQDQFIKSDFLKVPQKYKQIGIGIIKADDSGNLQGSAIFV